MKLKKNLGVLILFTIISMAGYSQKDSQRPFVLNNTNTGEGIKEVITVTHRDDGDLQIDIDLTGVRSMEGLDDPLNDVLTEELGEGAFLTGVGWDVSITTVGVSWLSEVMVYFDGSDQDHDGLFLYPGTGMSGTGNFSSGGILDLTDNGVADIPILEDGLLYIQFYEARNDNVGTVDADWSGTLSIVFSPGEASVPTMGSYGLIFFILALGFIALKNRTG